MFLSSAYEKLVQEFRDPEPIRKFKNTLTILGMFCVVSILFFLLISVVNGVLLFVLPSIVITAIAAVVYFIESGLLSLALRKNYRWLVGIIAGLNTFGIMVSFIFTVIFLVMLIPGIYEMWDVILAGLPMMQYFVSSLLSAVSVDDEAFQIVITYAITFAILITLLIVFIRYVRYSISSLIQAFRRHPNILIYADGIAIRHYTEDDMKEVFQILTSYYKEFIQSKENQKDVARSIWKEYFEDVDMESQVRVMTLHGVVIGVLVDNTAKNNRQWDIDSIHIDISIPDSILLHQRFIEDLVYRRGRQHKKEYHLRMYRAENTLIEQLQDLGWKQEQSEISKLIPQSMNSTKHVHLVYKKPV